MGKLKQKWATLTDNDLEFLDGNLEELLGRIQRRPVKPVRWLKNSSRKAHHHVAANKMKTSHDQSFFTAVRKNLFLGFVAILTLVALSGCGGGSPFTLTQANVDKIQQDMSSKEVKSILGEPTETKSEPIPVVGGTKTTFVYTNKEDRVVIVLKNDNVQTKEAKFSTIR